MFPVIILFTRFGVAASHCIVMIGNAKLFEVRQAAKALAIPMCIARAAMGISPLISTLKQPTPMYILCTSCLVALIFSQFLKVAPKAHLQKRKLKRSPSEIKATLDIQKVSQPIK